MSIPSGMKPKYRLIIEELQSCRLWIETVHNHLGKRPKNRENGVYFEGNVGKRAGSLHWRKVLRI